MKLKNLLVKLFFTTALSMLFSFKVFAQENSSDSIQFLLIGNSCSQNNELNFQNNLAPVSPESGFKMDGYWVWGGSVIKVGETYHMFASRWPQKNIFPEDYHTDSEIVRATSDSPLGPYIFQEVVIGERDSLFWDSNMAHNPTIHKIGDKYVMFYIGRDFTTLRPGDEHLIRRIGYATATNIEGPWKRSDKAVINDESNNPALLIEPGGMVKLLYRDEKLKVKLAEADNYMGPYRVVNENVWDKAKIEDFYLFKKDEKYHFICEDAVGVATGHKRWGANFVSENGIDNWHTYNPVICYDHDIIMENGEVLHCVRRERPQLLIEENKITYLLNGVYDGNNSWCQPVKLISPVSVD